MANVSGFHIFNKPEEEKGEKKKPFWCVYKNVRDSHLVVSHMYSL